MKVIHKGIELPFDLPISATKIPNEYFTILPPIPNPDTALRYWILTVDAETGELEWEFDVYNDY